MNEETIFAAALELESAERADYLAKACGGNSTLRKRLEGLLAASERAGNFMARPAVASAEPANAATEIVDGESTPHDVTPRWVHAFVRGAIRSSFLSLSIDPARFARPHRALRGAASPRQGRLRHRLPGVRRRAAAGRRGQGDGPATGRHLAGPQAVPARGPHVGPGPARERRAGVRGRGAAAAVPGDGVHPRRDAPAAARPHRPARCRPRCCGSAGRSPRGWPRPTRPT